MTYCIFLGNLSYWNRLQDREGIRYEKGRDLMIFPPKTHTSLEVLGFQEEALDVL
jgi:hypothetical protein